MQNKTAFVIMLTLGIALFVGTVAVTLIVQSASAICSSKHPNVCVVGTNPILHNRAVVGTHVATTVPCSEGCLPSASSTTTAANSADPSCSGGAKPGASARGSLVCAP